MKVEVWTKLITQIIHNEFERRGLEAPEIPTPFDPDPVLDLITEQADTIAAQTVRIDKQSAGIEAHHITITRLTNKLADQQSTLNSIEGLMHGMSALRSDTNALTAALDAVSKQEGPRGKPGKSPDAAVVAGLVRDEIKDDIIAAIPDPIKGEQGEPGTTGIPGADYVMRDKDFNAIVKDVTDRIEIPDPIKGIPGDVGPSPTQGQIDAAIEKLLPDIRKSLAKMLPEMKHQGVFQPGQDYQPGDEVIKGDSTFRAMESTHEAPPGDDWQCISKGKAGRRGEPGEQGEQGETGAHGKDGISVKDMVMDGTMLVQELSDGTVLTLDMSEFIEAIIKAIGE